MLKRRTICTCAGGGVISEIDRQLQNGRLDPLHIDHSWESCFPAEVGLQAAQQAAANPHTFGQWCCTTLQRSTQKFGFTHLYGLPEDERLKIARLLLHAATLHYYTVACASQAPDPTHAAATSSGAAHAHAPGRMPRVAANGNAWPYDEPCAEPLFAALKPQHQWWLITDILVQLWSPEQAM